MLHHNKFSYSLDGQIFYLKPPHFHLDKDQIIFLIKLNQLLYHLKIQVFHY